IKMLSYILILYPVFFGVIILADLITGETLHLIRDVTIFGGSLALLAIMYFTQAWKLASHAVLFICALVIWSNLLVDVQGIDILTLQCIWLGSMLSFYMLGSKWGWFYSALNILPFVLFTAFNNGRLFTNGIITIDQN